MTLFDLLKGKKMMVETDMKATIELEIKEVKQNNHSRELEQATAKNDWWPAEERWTNFTVYFTNGASKTYDSIEHIKVF